MGLATALRDVLSPVHGGRMFYEIVIVPDAEPEALGHLKKKSRDLRILTAPLGDPRRARLDFRAVRGGVVVQGADVDDPAELQVVSQRQPTPGELADLRTAWTVCKHVKSNGVVYVKDGLLKDRRVVPAGQGDGAVRELLAALQQRGYTGFLSLEPHLAQAGAFSGFSGPELFGVAVKALRDLLNDL
mgnify:CR=1 FL=1